MESRIEIRPGRNINLVRFIHPEPKGTIFLIHGLGGRGSQWRVQIPVLKKDYTLIVPDLYGHDKSDAPVPGAVNPYSFAEIFQDLQALFNQYAGKNNMIFGHSYGGAFSTDLCIKHQDKVSKLVLLTPTPCMPTIEIPTVYRLPLFILNFLRPLLEKQFVKLAFNKTTNEQLIKVEVEESRKNPIYLIKSLITGMNTIIPADVSQLETPTLLIQGMNDLLVPPVLQDQFYHVIPHLQVCQINDAAHLVLLEQPEKVNQAILKFLATP